MHASISTIYTRTRIRACNRFHRSIESLIRQRFQLKSSGIVLNDIRVLVVGFICATEIASHVNIVLEHVHALDN